MSENQRAKPGKGGNRGAGTGKRQPRPSHELFWTRREVAALLCVSLETVAALSRRRDKPLPCLRLGARTVLFPKDRVLRWLDEHPTVAEEAWGRTG